MKESVPPPHEERQGNSFMNCIFLYSFAVHSLAFISYRIFNSGGKENSRQMRVSSFALKPEFRNFLLGIFAARTHQWVVL
jgi:hypothetical protein